jgi:hypothetical protein
MQQINLYTQDLRPKHIILPLAHIVVVVAVVLLIQIVFTVYYQSEVAAIEARLPSKQTNVDQLQRQTVEMEVKLSTMRKDPSLLALNKKLTERLVSRKQLISMLDSLSVANQYPFSNLMVGLARHRVDALWLTQIQFANGGQKLGLKGKTLQAESVPHYVQMLRGETLFLGRAFDLFQLTSDENIEKLLHFTLSSSFMNLGDGDEQ